MADMQDRLPVANMGEQHVPVVLLVDTSGSMSGEPIRELNQGLVEFYNALQGDSMALGRADVSVISFDTTVNVRMGFRPAEQYEAPTLKPGALTSMNQGIIKALDEIEDRKRLYKQQGVKYYRPWLFVLTDGLPTDDEFEAEAVQRMRTAIENKKVTYMPMGIGPNADLDQLKKYYPANAPAKTTLHATATDFRSAFQWLSASIAEITHSDPKVTPNVTLPGTPSNITVGI